MMFQAQTSARRILSIFFPIPWSARPPATGWVGQIKLGVCNLAGSERGKIAYAYSSRKQKVATPKVAGLQEPFYKWKAKLKFGID